MSGHHAALYGGGLSSAPAAEVSDEEPDHWQQVDPVGEFRFSVIDPDNRLSIFSVRPSDADAFAVAMNEVSQLFAGHDVFRHHDHVKAAARKAHAAGVVDFVHLSAVDESFDAGFDVVEKAVFKEIAAFVKNIRVVSVGDDMQALSPKRTMSERNKRDSKRLKKLVNESDSDSSEFERLASDTLIVQNKLSALNNHADPALLPEPKQIVKVIKAADKNKGQFVHSDPIDCHKWTPMYVGQAMSAADRKAFIKTMSEKTPSASKVVEQARAFWMSHAVAGVVYESSVLEHVGILLRMMHEKSVAFAAYDRRLTSMAF